jgi:hypothetical protein
MTAVLLFLAGWFVLGAAVALVPGPVLARRGGSGE